MPKNEIPKNEVQDPKAKVNYIGWKLIFERAIKVDPETGAMYSYWPEYWSLEKLGAKWLSIGSAAFGAGYQNDPTALDGNMLSASWITYYEQSELMLARQAAGVSRGLMYIGIDPANGGVGSQADPCAGIVLERIGHVAYAVGILNKRLPIEIQAQAVEEFADEFAPYTGAVIEDTSAKGYVYAALKSGINGGKGTRHNFRIEKPQGGNANGNKDRRFMSMGPRFEFGQIRLPGVRTSVGIVVDDRWAAFVEQFKAYPGGHDDMLDAMYWAQWACFGVEAPIASSRSPISLSTAMDAKIDNVASTEICQRPAHRKFGFPVAQCYRCSMELQERMLERREFQEIKPSIGAPSFRRESLRIMR